MKVNKEFLTFARRLHNGLRQAIEDGDGRTGDVWLNEERPYFEHYSCGLFLNGCLAFLEGKFGKSSWLKRGQKKDNFDDFISSADHKENFLKYGISSKGLDALVCIRNSMTHNANDISKNSDKTCVNKITDAKIIGVTIENNIVLLTSNKETDFMEFVRLSFIAVSMYHYKLVDKVER